MLDLLLVTMSLISVVCIFFLCYVGYTLSEELKHNDSVINELQDEIDKLESELFIVKEERNEYLMKIEDLFTYGGWSHINDAIKHYKKYVVKKKSSNYRK